MDFDNDDFEDKDDLHYVRHELECKTPVRASTQEEVRQAIKRVDNI